MPLLEASAPTKEVTAPGQWYDPVLERHLLSALKGEIGGRTVDEWRTVVDMVLMVAYHRKALPEFFGRLVTLHRELNDAFITVDKLVAFDMGVRAAAPKPKTTVRKKPSATLPVPAGVNEAMTNFRRVRQIFAAEFELITQCPPPGTTLS